MFEREYHVFGEDRISDTTKDRVNNLLTSMARTLANELEIVFEEQKDKGSQFLSAVTLLSHSFEVLTDHFAEKMVAHRVHSFLQDVGSARGTLTFLSISDLLTRVSKFNPEFMDKLHERVNAELSKNLQNNKH